MVAPKGDLAGAYNYVRNGDFATTRGLSLISDETN